MGVLRHPNGACLYSRRAPPYPHGVAAAHFPLTVRIDYPRQYSNSLLCLLVHWHKEPGDCITFQVNGITVFLAETSLPWERRPLNKQSPQLQGQKAKLFLVAQWGNREGLLLILSSLDW